MNTQVWIASAGPPLMEGKLHVELEECMLLHTISKLLVIGCTHRPGQHPIAWYRAVLGSPVSVEPRSLGICRRLSS